MSNDAIRFRRGIWISVTFILLLWTVQAFEVAFSMDLREFGILPRTLKGTIGIITGPLIHGDFFHLVSNTFPLIILGVGLFYFYHKIAFEVILIIYIMTGFWVWVVARDAYHIGSSGLVYGLLAFLFFSGLLRRDAKTLAVSLVLLFIYGGNMIYGIFPVNEAISWESHLMGALSGMFCAYFFKNSRSSVDTILEDETSEPEIVNDEPAPSGQSYTIVGKKEKKTGSSPTYNYDVDKEDLI